MPTKSRVWWWSAKKYWATQIDGKRVCLAKGRKNKKAAQEKLDQILAERALLANVEGPITVAALCEQFLDDANENLAPATPRHRLGIVAGERAGGDRNGKLHRLNWE